MSDYDTVTINRSDAIYAACTLESQADKDAELAKRVIGLGLDGAEMTRICLDRRGRAARIRRALEARR